MWSALALAVIALLFFLAGNSSNKVFRLLFSLFVFVFVLFTILFVVADHFSGNGIDDSVINMLLIGFEGFDIREFGTVIYISILAILVDLGFSAIIYFFHTQKPRYPAFNYIAFVLMVVALLFNPTASGLYRMYLEKTKGGDLHQYFSTEFKDHYIEPHIMSVGPHKNLVFIYAEGLENNFFDEDIFPGLVKELRTLESEGISFTNIQNVSGVGYSIAGTIGSQCGIPIIAPYQGNDLSSKTSVLPLSVCLGDLLRPQNYYLSYFEGASLRFAGYDTFFSMHSFDEVKGREELFAERTDNPPLSPWGLYDDALFETVFNRFTALSQSKNNFAIFLNTMDTHPPDGNPSPSCAGMLYRDGSSPLLNSVKCSDMLIPRFVNKIRNSPYGKNTVVVVVSDHLALQNSQTGLLESKPRRYFFVILDPDSKPMKINRLGSILDVGATTLSSIGFEGQIGLGRNLLNGNVDEGEIKEIHQKLDSWKEDFYSIWDFR